MRLAVLYYLVQTWTADRYGRAKRDKPGPCREPGPPHASTPAITASANSWPLWRSARAVLGGGSP
jgi:hypothetical protein